jgi:hypothetical protein
MLFASAIPAGASSHPPALSVSAWPARVVVAAPGSTTVRIGNSGASPVRLVASSRGYALDAFGRPRLRPPGAGWISVRPARLVVATHRVEEIEVRVERPAGARSGDHAQVLLVSTEPPSRRRLVATLRIGIVVVARVPGRIVHHLGVAHVQARHQGRQTTIELVVANRGNVDEWLVRGRVSVTLLRRGSRPVTLQVAARRLLARSSGIVEATLRGHLRGRLTVVVALRRPTPGVRLAHRRYQLRL